MSSRGGNTTVVGQYDANAGKLYVMEQEMASYNDPSQYNYGPLKDYLGGIFKYGSSTYPNYPTNGDAAEIFSLVGYKDGSYVLEAGSCDYGAFNAFRFRWIIQTGDYAGMGNTYSTTSLPITDVQKVEMTAAKYEDFLGTWTVGEDTWTIKEKTPGETYSVTGLYGQDYLEGSVKEVEGGYDAANGQFFIMEQLLGAYESSTEGEGVCYEAIAGIFTYSGTQYANYVFNSTTPVKLFTGRMQAGGSVELVPGTGAYAMFDGFDFLWFSVENDEAGGRFGAVTPLPATMIKASGMSAPRSMSNRPEATFVSIEPDKMLEPAQVLKAEKKQSPRHSGKSIEKAVRF